MIEILDLFLFSEDDTGPFVRANNAEVSISRPAALTKELPDVGVFRVRPLTTDLVRSLPDWEGLALAGGELFVDESGDFVPTYVLVNASAYTTIMPLGGNDTDRLVDQLRNITIEWIVQ